MNNIPLIMHVELSSLSLIAILITVVALTFLLRGKKPKS